MGAALVALTAASAGANTRPWAPADPRLLTRWAKLVGPEHAHPEHPRPGLTARHNNTCVHRPVLPHARRGRTGVLMLTAACNFPSWPSGNWELPLCPLVTHTAARTPTPLDLATARPTNGSGCHADLYRAGAASWQSLNGLWEADSTPANLSNVPFAPAVSSSRPPRGQPAGTGCFASAGWSCTMWWRPAQQSQRGSTMPCGCVRARVVPLPLPRLSQTRFSSPFRSSRRCRACASSRSTVTCGTGGRCPCPATPRQLWRLGQHACS